MLDALPGSGLGALQSPSISLDGSICYMPGALEATYRSNLAKPLSALLDAMPDAENCVMGVVTDPKLKEPARIRLITGDAPMAA